MRGPFLKMRRPLLSRALRVIGFISFVLAFFLAGCENSHNGNIQAPAQPPNPHSVTISWTASKSPVVGYNVYRILQSGGTVKVTSGIVSSTKYTDRTVEAGRTYAYFVTAVDAKGIESKPSEKITVNVPTAVAPPANP